MGLTGAPASGDDAKTEAGLRAAPDSAAMATVIRPARSNDADFIAWVILSAQRGHRPRGWFDLALDLPESQTIDFIRRLATARNPSWWHVSNFLIAEVDGVAAAALCALRSGDGRTALRPAIEEVADAAGINAAAQSDIWRRGAYARPCWIQGDDDDWLVEHVATRLAYRGRGLVLALLDRACELGRARGYGGASITFYIGNEAAERCYAKAGFHFAEEKRDAGFEALTGTPGFRRFERTL